MEEEYTMPTELSEEQEQYWLHWCWVEATEPDPWEND